MEINGKIIKVLAPQTFNSGKTKYTFVLETSGQYPQQIPFDVWGEDKWKEMKIQEEKSVSVSFDIRGTEHNGRYFVNLNAWKVAPQDAQNGGGSSNAPAPANNNNEEDDSPF